MSYKIAIASGKGGTGKTTVSVNLNRYLRQEEKRQVYLVDCDVEEPNDLLFYPQAKCTGEEIITQLVPEIDPDKCTYCGRCAEYCEFNAISIISKVKYSNVDAGLCHSCGACTYACEYEAILEKPKEIGKVSFYESAGGCLLAEGRLKIGSPMQTMVIKALKDRIPLDNDITLYDAPPGTSCPVVETMSDVDYVVLVAEPTRFGLHDMKLMVDLVRELSLPFGVVINKAGLGDQEIYRYIKEENLNLLGEIPFSKDYAAIYAKGEINAKVPQEIEEAYATIVKNLLVGAKIPQG